MLTILGSVTWPSGVRVRGAAAVERFAPDGLGDKPALICRASLARRDQPPVYLFPLIDGSLASFIRSSSNGPPGLNSHAGRPSTFVPNCSSSSRRTGSL